MGIKNLMKIIPNNAITPLPIKNLLGKKIAIDSSIVLYQYVTALRSNGNDLTGPDGKSTSHIWAILVKTIQYLKAGIIPIHIFDGKPPSIKSTILANRTLLKKEAVEKIDKVIKQIETSTGDKKKQLVQEKNKLLRQAVSISRQQTKESCEIASLLGVPCIQAIEEADSQCAYLSKNGLVDYVATEDMDLLTFGSKKIIKKFMKHDMFVIDLEKILVKEKLSMDQFIDTCILLGCDYTGTIGKIGYKRAIDFIKKYNSIDNLIKEEPKIKQGIYKVPENFIYNEVKEYFKNPKIIPLQEKDLCLKEPKLDMLENILVDKYGFSKDNVKNLLCPLRQDEISDEPFI